MVNDKTGFSLWVDFIERDFIKTTLKELIKDNIVDGATSNPSIFANAITTSPAYKEQLVNLKDKSPKEKYEALAIKDIKNAAKVLSVCYNAGYEGFISIEVDPYLSNDAKATIEEGVRLFKEIDEPNVMIKVPATEAGYEAMRELTKMGISVNATLIFSPSQAIKAKEALSQGIKEFSSFSGEGRVEGVISIFVSRFDRKLDPILKEKGIPTAKTGILNAAKIYNLIMQEKNPAIKPLFASTGVKESQDLPKDYYITSLVAPHSINTAPLDTIRAYESNPQKDKLALPIDDATIDEYFKELVKAGINMDNIYDELMQEGLKAFEDSFSSMLKSLE